MSDTDTASAPSPPIDEVISAKESELIGINARIDSARINLKSTMDTLDSTKAELSEVRGNLAAQLQRSQQEFEQSVYEKDQELADITARLTASKEALAANTDGLVSIAQRHKQVQDMLAAIRKTIDG